MVATTMVKITIDGRIAEVAPATTVLHAAEGLGISIPTLCHLEGCSPTTSCQICLVKNALTGQFVPSCATKVTDGMIVESETEEVHEMRRTALELLLSDHLGDCLAPCFFACPAHMDIPLMLQQIGDRHLQDAVATIKRDIAMPATLGRVCPKPCEKGCRRNASDEPVTVCELKRHVADVDLASGDPYVPTCLPDTGKRIAIVGAGPTGLAAAFYLRQQGHACDLFERQPEAGGRLHDECASGTLPIDVLRGEVRQVEKVGVNFHLATPIADRHAWDRLLDEFDVVVACCGASDVAQLQSWGLPVDKRGVAINKETYQTDNPRLFAAGNAIRGKGLVVRSIADGKEAAIAIGQYLVGEVVRGPGKPFSSRIGKLTAEEMPPYLAGALNVPRQEPVKNALFVLDNAVEQSERCLACGCQGHGTCRLEAYSQQYDADSSRYAGERRPYEVVNRGGHVLFEPGKCIKCELCVQIAERAGEPLGITFVGRGFDVRLQVPFGHTIDEGLGNVARQCVEACPTAALYFAR